MPSYDPNNIFAKILRGELPCYKVYEDDKALAFLDIMPRAPGHTLVLPKAPARNILDVAPDDLAHVIKVAQKIAKAAIGAFGADGVTLQQFNEGAGGQVVFHLHVHVIPRKTGVADEAAGEREGKARGAGRAGQETGRRDRRALARDDLSHSAASACRLTLLSAICVSVSSVFFSSCKVCSSSRAASCSPSSAAQVFSVP